MNAYPERAREGVFSTFEERKQVAREEKPFLVMVGQAQAQAARRLAHVKRTLPAHSPNLPVPVPTSPSPSPSSSMCAASASSSSSSASTHAGPRARILCLHGYENSKEIMHKQMRMAGWLGSERKSDEKVVPFENCDFVFVSAPFASEPPVSKIVEHFFPEDPKRQWFERIQNEEAGVRYLGLDVGLKHIEDALEKEGPFDGIFGFSQGAGLSLVVAAKQQQGEMLGNNPPLKFAIVIAGKENEENEGKTEGKCSLLCVVVVFFLTKKHFFFSFTHMSLLPSSSSSSICCC